MTAVQELGSLPWSASLTPAERDRLAQVARATHYQPGQQLFSVGEPADACWVIRAGQVALQTPMPGRGEVVVQTVGPGDLVGWSWLVPPRQWHFSATAVGPVDAWQLDGRELERLMDEDPAFARSLLLALLPVVVHRLQATRARLLDLYRNPSDREGGR